MAGNKFAPSGIKGFFVFHAEKVVLGGCVALVALFFCMGWGVPRMPVDQTPQELFKRFKEGEKHLAVKNIWDELGPTRAVEANHLDRAVRSRKNVVEDPYKISKVWKLGDVPLNEKRTDPALYPPERVLAYAFVTALAQRRVAGKPNPWDGLAGAELAVAPAQPEPEKKKEPRPPRRRKGDPEDDPLAIEEDPISPIEEAPPPEDNPLVDGPVGFGGNVRTLSPAQMDELLKNSWRTVSGAESSYPKGGTIIAVTAVVPFKKQLAEYDRCFDSAMGYDPKRDRPDYFFMVAERAEVPDSGPVDDAALKWVVITNSTNEQKYNKFWSNYSIEELVDGKNLHAALSSRIPAAMLVDAVKFAAHPDVPFRTPERIEQDKRAATSPQNKGEDGSPMDTVLASDPGGLSSVPMPAAPGVPDDPGIDPVDPVDSVDPVDLPPEGDVGVDEGDTGTITAVKKPEEEVADKLLVRFYDYNAVQGKSYKYRVKVFLRDPNNPEPAPAGAARPGEEGQAVGNYAPPVPDRMLADEALERVRANRAKYYIETAFSAPSPAVRVPTLPIKLLAGDVNAARISTLPQGARMVRDVDKAKVLTVVWDESLGTNVPGLIEAFRGTLLNYRSTADILNPLNYAIKRYPDYNFKTDALVVDMRGGESVGKSQIQTPGEVLLVDKDGQLIVRNEFDPKNVESYRRQLFIEDRSQSPSGGGAAPGDFNPLGGPLDDSPLGR